MNEPREVTSEEATDILLNQSEEGLFYLLDGEEYVGIICKDGSSESKDFPSRVECLKWLKGEA